MIPHLGRLWVNTNLQMCLEARLRFLLLSFLLGGLTFGGEISIFRRLFWFFLHFLSYWQHAVVFCIQFLTWEVVLEFERMLKIDTTTLALVLQGRNIKVVFFATFAKRFLVDMAGRLFFLNFGAHRLTDARVIFKLTWLLGLSLVFSCIFIEVCTIFERGRRSFLKIGIFVVFLTVEIVSHLTPRCNFRRLTIMKNLRLYDWVGSVFLHRSVQTVLLLFTGISLLIAPKTLNEMKIWNLITYWQPAKGRDGFYYRNERKHFVRRSVIDLQNQNWMLALRNLAG